MTESIKKESFQAADIVIADLKEMGRDYSAVRDKIADIFETRLWHGNWDCTLDLDDDNLDSLRFVQEDEFDQHMGNDGGGDEDENSGPEYDLYSYGHYIIIEERMEETPSPI